MQRQVFFSGLVRGIVARRVSEDESTNRDVPRLRVGLLFLPITLVIEFDKALVLKQGTPDGEELKKLETPRGFLRLIGV